LDESSEKFIPKKKKSKIFNGKLVPFVTFCLLEAYHCFVLAKNIHDLSSSEVLYWHVPKSMEYMQGVELDLWAVFEDPDHPKI